MSKPIGGQQETSKEIEPTADAPTPAKNVRQAISDGPEPPQQQLQRTVRTPRNNAKKGRKRLRRQAKTSGNGDGNPEAPSDSLRNAPKPVNDDSEKDKSPVLPYEHVLSGLRESRKRRVLLRHKSYLRSHEAKQHTDSARILQTETSGALQPENDFEKTYHVRQTDIVRGADLATTTKAAFNLDLDDTNLGPYLAATYSRSGRALLVASRRGHVAVADWRAAKLACELHLNETVRGATFLHNDTFFATAQKEHAYIYDAASGGAQVHVLRTHREPGAITFLPHHLLLATASAPAAAAAHAELVYTDTTTGAVVARHDFAGRALALGAAHAIAHNRANGVVALAHARGVVSLWSPAEGRPLARVFLHAGGVRCVDVSHDGVHLVSAGADGELAVTDLRTFRTVLRQRLPATPSAVAVSQRGMMAVACGATVQVWQPARRTSPAQQRKMKAEAALGDVTPYMTETFSGQPVSGLEFCPFEDVLTVCRHGGVRTMLVPGAGEPTFDSSAPNPYDKRAQKREREVKALLDKLPAESIVLDADTIGDVDVDPAARREAIQRAQDRARVVQLRGARERDRKKGRNKISKRVHRRKQRLEEANRIERTGQVEARRETLQLARKIAAKRHTDAASGVGPGGLQNQDDVPEALARFMPKS